MKNIEKFAMRIRNKQPGPFGFLYESVLQEKVTDKFACENIVDELLNRREGPCQHAFHRLDPSRLQDVCRKTCGSLMARYRFWIHDKDRKGRPLDENILKTAESIAPTLTRYRQQEIDCESTSNDMLQSAVEAASIATRRNHIENPPGYLTQIYKRIVDRFLDREQRLVPVDDEFLEDLVNGGHGPAVEDVIHNRLLLERLIDAMDEETRLICSWRLEGYSEAEIARLLNTSPNAVSVRYTRGFKKAIKHALNGKRRLKTK